MLREELDQKLENTGLRKYLGITGRKYQDSGGNCLIMSFMICNRHQTSFGPYINDHETGWACGKQWGENKFYLKF
jgi:hypothetical protein